MGFKKSNEQLKLKRLSISRVDFVDCCTTRTSRVDSRASLSLTQTTIVASIRTHALANAPSDCRTANDQRQQA